MKSNEELRESAKLAAENIANALNHGGGMTLTSLVKLEAAARVMVCALNALKQRAAGVPAPKEGE